MGVGAFVAAEQALEAPRRCGRALAAELTSIGVAPGPILWCGRTRCSAGVAAGCGAVGGVRDV
jgi:hypothetical protein